MRRLALAASVVVAVASACAVLPHPGDGIKQPHRIDAPKLDRCGAMPEGMRQRKCDEEHAEAITFIRRLSVNDQVCLEGNPLQNGITGRCRVRAFVEDVDPRTVKLEVREAAPDSRYNPMDDYWFETGALVDLYLYSEGYLLDHEREAALKNLR